MITPDDNGYSRLKRWRERNRGLANLRQREYRRKKKSGGGVEGHAHSLRDHESASQWGSSGEETGSPTPSENQASPARPFQTKKVGEFRMLVLPEENREEAPVKPVIFRNDYGAQISERAWKLLQKKKQEAKEGGYELDEYSQ